jgi:hypothetical protein
MYYTAQSVWDTQRHAVIAVPGKKGSAWCWDARGLEHTEPLVDREWGFIQPFVQALPEAQAAVAAGSVVPQSQYRAPVWPPHVLRLHDHTTACVHRLAPTHFRYEPGPRPKDTPRDVVEATSALELLWRIGLSGQHRLGQQLRPRLEALPALRRRRRGPSTVVSTPE